ncbi:nucleopolyhedrovirus p26 protein [Alphaentomopoxvirus acuprea]|uniref:Nucleopolyhedrovirus p26 protein n=1 Tax=Alphaentomopoxvirus acuprea TaxID=62099 RepID=W6JPM5_9POXV|nr:nucleopolyhedrovirus p26 protein [Anomala cuprea entomopoxvirus]BAO49539.1 nucleopolyhedrovirus p26 protein [Anomala cuprea entomopoxvirus]
MDIISWGLYNNKYVTIDNYYIKPIHFSDKNSINKYYQFPNLITEKLLSKNIYDHKKIMIIDDNANILNFNVNDSVLTYHKFNHSIIGGILPGFKYEKFIYPGTPIFDSNTGELISIITINYKYKNYYIYPISGPGKSSWNIKFKGFDPKIYYVELSKTQSEYIKDETKNNTYMDDKYFDIVITINRFDNIVNLIKVQSNGYELERMRFECNENIKVIT